MTYIKPFLVPPMGDAFDEARVVGWNVEVGQPFANGDVLLEIETDKSVVEIQATENGKLVERLIAKGELLQADQPVARIEVEGAEPAREEKAEARIDAPPVPDVAVPAHEPEAAVDAMRSGDGRRHFATPVARRLAATNGIDLADVHGTGPRGRITKSDLEAVLGTGNAVSGQSPRMPKSIGESCNVATSHGELHARLSLAAADPAAPTIVFVHGIFGDADTWTSTRASVGRKGRHAIAIDLPCHGRSAADVSRFEDMVDALAQAVAKLCHGRIAWVGHSLGAAAAVRAARRLAGQTASVTLFAPAGLGTEIDQSFLDGMRHARSREALLRETGKLTAGGPSLSAAYLDELSRNLAARAEPLAAICNDVSREGVQQIDIRADLEGLSCPVTIVHGRNDRIIPWKHVLNAPPRAALHIVPDAGHMPQVEAMALSDEILERMFRLSA